MADDLRRLPRHGQPLRDIKARIVAHGASMRMAFALSPSQGAAARPLAPITAWPQEVLKEIGSTPA
ncbi:MAG: hypothetical protein ACREXV_09840 [Polaromonas sp.]